MQKCFIVRNGYDVIKNELAELNLFVGTQGKILSVTASKPIDEEKEYGSWFVVADDGKAQSNPLD